MKIIIGKYEGTIYPEANVYTRSVWRNLGALVLDLVCRTSRSRKFNHGNLDHRRHHDSGVEN